MIEVHPTTTRTPVFSRRTVARNAISGQPAPAPLVRRPRWQRGHWFGSRRECRRCCCAEHASPGAHPVRWRADIGGASAAERRLAEGPTRPTRLNTWRYDLGHSTANVLIEDSAVADTAYIDARWCPRMAARWRWTPGILKDLF
jgi:hypothetical protein